MVKQTKKHQKVVRKVKAKSQGGHPPRHNRRGRKPSTDVIPGEEKFTYEGTFTQKEDDL